MKTKNRERGGKVEFNWWVENEDYEGSNSMERETVNSRGTYTVRIWVLEA